MKSEKRSEIEEIGERERERERERREELKPAMDNRERCQRIAQTHYKMLIALLLSPHHTLIEGTYFSEWSR